MSGPDGVRDVSLQEIEDGLAAGTLVLVDVREPGEFASGAIPGSVSMPLSRFDPDLLAGFGAARVVFSCASGVRSQHAIAFAQGAGLALSEHNPGGFKGWAASGRPVEMDR